MLNCKSKYLDPKMPFNAFKKAIEGLDDNKLMVISNFFPASYKEKQAYIARKLGNKSIKYLKAAVKADLPRLLTSAPIPIDLIAYTYIKEAIKYDSKKVFLLLIQYLNLLDFDVFRYLVDNGNEYFLKYMAKRIPRSEINASIIRILIHPRKDTKNILRILMANTSSESLAEYITTSFYSSTPASALLRNMNEYSVLDPVISLAILTRSNFPLKHLDIPILLSKLPRSNKFIESMIVYRFLGNKKILNAVMNHFSPDAKGYVYVC